MVKATAIGTSLQTLMVVVGHYAPALAEAGLFPIGGTLIGFVTGWLAGAGGTKTAAGSYGADQEAWLGEWPACSGAWCQRLLATWP